MVSFGIFPTIAHLWRNISDCGPANKFKNWQSHSGFPDPGFLPYYPQSFFQTIKNVHEKTALNVKTMSTSQWARVLTEEGLTMEQVPNQESMQYIPCRSELSAPQNDWQLSWKLCRSTGLNSDMISFNFKLLHHILPVRHRLNQLTPTTSPLCILCINSSPETVQHALLTCQYNDGSGQALVSTLQRILPALTTDKLLLLQLPSLQEALEMFMSLYSRSQMLTPQRNQIPQQLCNFERFTWKFVNKVCLNKEVKKLKILYH